MPDRAGQDQNQKKRETWLARSREDSLRVIKPPKIPNPLFMFINDLHPNNKEEYLCDIHAAARSATIQNLQCSAAACVCTIIIYYYNRLQLFGVQRKTPPERKRDVCGGAGQAWQAGEIVCCASGARFQSAQMHFLSPWLPSLTRNFW